MLYQPYTAPYICPSANLPSFSSVPTANTINPSPVNTHFYTVFFVAMKKLVKTFDGQDHQYTPENYLFHNDDQVIFATIEQLLRPVAY